MSEIPAGQISTFSRQEIDAFFKTAMGLYRSASATILAAPRSGSFARILIVTPRQIGNAVTRNKLRRRIKSLFYQASKAQPFTHDIAVIARRPITQCTFQELKELLSNAWSKIPQKS